VPCPSCGSANLDKFESEISIHFPQLKDVAKPKVLVFAELLVCLSCGRTEFVVPETQLSLLVDRAVKRREAQT
jgi:predicted nucleic-acid-binding Zn-ribbon protein